MTGTGNVVGTADYMSPEQVKGDKVDGRSDLFSVGCLLFELITGRRPFHSDNLMAIFYKITHEGANFAVFPKEPEPAALEPIVRKHVIEILDSLPVGETFDWVDKVSVELTTNMLATMFDFDWDTRRKLTYWSDMTTAGPDQLADMGKTPQDRQEALLECLDVFTKLWHERKGKEVESLDFVTALANGAATRDMGPMEYLGTLVLLIVGGNDTTRNSISGGVVALNENPAEYQKLRDDPKLIPNMVSEIIRWQTPLAHMRRTATRDTELGGKQIKKGDKVVMWYVSGNRDESVIDRANEFLIDRENARQHLSFGWGVHFCMGSRLAEMQLRILWEETLRRFRIVEVVGEPVRVRSNFVKGFAELPVRVHPW